MIFQLPLRLIHFLGEGIPRKEEGVVGVEGEKDSSPSKLPLREPDLERTGLSAVKSNEFN